MITLRLSYLEIGNTYFSDTPALSSISGERAGSLGELIVGECTGCFLGWQLYCSKQTAVVLATSVGTQTPTHPGPRSGREKAKALRYVH